MAALVRDDIERLLYRCGDGDFPVDVHGRSLWGANAGPRPCARGASDFALWLPIRGRMLDETMTNGTNLAAALGGWSARHRIAASAGGCCSSS